MQTNLTPTTAIPRILIPKVPVPVTTPPRVVVPVATPKVVTAFGGVATPPRVVTAFGGVATPQRIVVATPKVATPPRLVVATPPKVVVPVTNPKVVVPVATPKVTVPVTNPKVVVPVTLKVAVPATKVVIPVRTQPIATPFAEPERKELVLGDWQVAWANRAAEILRRSHGYIDTSEPGTGKTFIVLWLAKQFNFRLFVVCPVTMMDIWRREAATYDVEIVDVISYQSLRSKKNAQPKHGYLDRHDVRTEGGMNFVTFTPTQAWENLVEQGLLYVCDEMQYIKNNSSQYKAAAAMARPILHGGVSRFGLLSGTPFDKPEMAENLLRFIGYIRSPRLYNYNARTRSLVLEGMQELIDAARFTDNLETERILAEIPQVKSRMKELCFALYTRVIKNGIVGAMPTPTTIEGAFDAKNGFYNIRRERVQELQDAIDALATAAHYNEGQQTVNIGQDNIGAVTKALVRIEVAKADDMARVAIFTLTANPSAKIIVCVNYHDTVNSLRQALAGYHPLVLTGKTQQQQRGAVIYGFNNDPNARLLIMNTAVGGVGISLHDTRGDAPRVMFISPSYKILDTAQACGRIYRAGTISDATVRMFYGKGVGDESGILNAMARKTATLKATFAEGIERAMLLPGDYASEQEVD